MGHAAMKKLEGIAAMGGEVPYFDPEKLVIVGLDEPETPENWFAHCSRLADVKDEDLTDYVAEILATDKIDNIAKAVRDGDRLILLDGRRTVRAARLVREIQAKKHVPLGERACVRVNIVKGDPDDLFRTNLDSHKHQPLTRTQYARGVLTYYTKVQEDMTKTAAFFRTTPQTVKVLLAHFDLSAGAQKAIDAKEIPATATKALSKMPRAKQDETIAKMKAKGVTKGRAATTALEEAGKDETIQGQGKAPRMRSRQFLEKWMIELSKAKFNDLAGVIGFVLGGPLPTEIRGKDHEEILERVGYEK